MIAGIAACAFADGEATGPTDSVAMDIIRCSAGTAAARTGAGPIGAAGPGADGTGAAGRGSGGLPFVAGVVTGVGGVVQASVGPVFAGPGSAEPVCAGPA